VKGAKIEIVKAAEGADDGEVIIRLLDVFELPEKPVFRIDPLDDDARRDDCVGWPSGDLIVSRMRVGEKGVEMSVAAEVIDWPALLPGTPVAVSIQSASIREELRWPSLGALRSARRGTVVVSAERRRAEIAARAKARRAELESLAAVRLAAEAESANEVAGSESAPAVAVGEGLSRLDVKRKGTIKLVTSSEEAPKSPAPAEPPVGPTASTPQKNTEEPQSPAPPVAADNVPTPVPALANLSPPPPVKRVAAPPTSAPVDPPLPDFYPSRTTGAAPVSRGATKPPGPATPPPLPARAPVAAAKTVAPAGTPHSLPGHTPKFLTRQGEQARSFYTFQRAFGLGFLVAALLAIASTFALRGGGDFAGLLSSPAQQSTASKAIEQPSTLTTLSGILAVPEVSTQGDQATAIDLAGALKKADQSLAGSSISDKEEAKYWLRRSIALGLGEQRLVWALTQLGTLYAAPATGAPDYASARTLWELSAAQGDPIALCFLASLHEHGLGVVKDEVRALNLYRNAKTHGGCRNVDQSIARLTKGAP